MDNLSLTIFQLFGCFTLAALNMNTEEHMSCLRKWAIKGEVDRNSNNFLSSFRIITYSLHIIDTLRASVILMHMKVFSCKKLLRVFQHFFKWMFFSFEIFHKCIKVSCLCALLAGRRALWELSMSVQLESDGKRKRCDESVSNLCTHRKSSSTRKNWLQRKNAKSWSVAGFCFAIVRFEQWFCLPSECNWTEKFSQTCAGIKQAPIWIGISLSLFHFRRKQCAESSTTEKVKPEKYITMHFCEVFLFLHILPFSMSGTYRLLCVCVWIRFLCEFCSQRIRLTRICALKCDSTPGRK